MKTVNLQSVGEHKAKPAQDFSIGEEMVWNFGSKSEVVAILKETAKFITFSLLCSDGNVYAKRLKKDRLVAFA